ncbi:hypothetical protein [Brumicola pallidula]|uniref:Uncharacterized protein n=1 Tax=Brumicola pallidula DSM 14239 = ACAM 615 TaxID=1121922 RepID=K6ZX36_9ALTE|nr:hypothetical protein [Glaciecola pallidula]GAC27890.1 hypothetical protein GPAL_1011 [Glaciecola pallidula DSM 14239 = ACAM 615]
MVVRITGNTITNCGTGISTPKDANVEIGANNISECKVAIELRDPPSFIESLGLNANTPTDKIVSVLNAIGSGSNDKESITAEVEKSGLLSYLSSAADITTLVSALYQISTSSLVNQAIALLPK